MERTTSVTSRSGFGGLNVLFALAIATSSALWTAVLMQASAKDEPIGDIRARSLTIVDAKNRSRILLRQANTWSDDKNIEAGPCLEFRDAKGQQRCSLGMELEDRMVFELDDPQGHPRFKVELMDGATVMNLFGAEGEGLLTAMVSQPSPESASGLIIVRDKQGRYFEQIPKPKEPSGK